MEADQLRMNLRSVFSTLSNGRISGKAGKAGSQIQVMLPLYHSSYREDIRMRIRGLFQAPTSGDGKHRALSGFVSMW